MKLARFVVGEHSRSCSGCPACSAEMAALLGRASGAAPPPPSLNELIRHAVGKPTVALAHPRVLRHDGVPEPVSLNDYILGLRQKEIR